MTKSSITPSRILVSGARGALGRATVDAFLLKGFEVYATERSEELVQNWDITPSKSQANLFWLPVDWTKPDSVALAFETLENDNRFPDCIIHCVGGFDFKYFADLEDETIEKLFQKNIFSALYLLREALPRMKKRTQGRIVFVGSLAAEQDPKAGMGVYAATKIALHASVKAAQDEVKEFDIAINAVLPGVIDTAANRAAMPTANFSNWVPVEEITRTFERLCGSEPSLPFRGCLIPVPGRG